MENLTDVNGNTFNVDVNGALVVDTATSINQLRTRMVELAEQKEALKRQLKEVDTALETVLKALGEGEVFQGGDGTVYRVEKHTGSFISFPDLTVKRTRKEGEKGGNYLSKKEVQELGFDV
jgi:hypothetical protein